MKRLAVLALATTILTGCSLRSPEYEGALRDLMPLDWEMPQSALPVDETHRRALETLTPISE